MFEGVCVEVRGCWKRFSPPCGFMDSNEVGRPCGKHLYPLGHLASLTPIILKACLGSDSWPEGCPVCTPVL